jgi:hypothetical protein
MTTADNERPAPNKRSMDRVTIDTQTAYSICDQCMDPATHRVLQDNVTLYLVCTRHLSLVRGFIEAHLTEDNDGANPGSDESTGGQ